MAIERYEMCERALDGCIAVEALLYEHRSRRPGGPPLAALQCSNDYMFSPTIRYVHPPGFIARLLGDTVEKRLERARRHVAAKAEQMIARDAKLIRAMA